MYIADLAPYIYMNHEPDQKLLAVGWLDADHAFARGAVPVASLSRILALFFRPVNATRGYHQSPFITSPLTGYLVEFRGARMLLGSAEIRVKGKDGIVYASPNLIYHYIKDCNYLPPQEFLNALALD